MLTGCFSGEIKIARVTDKGSDVNNINNYRPISVLPIFAKIAKHVINRRPCQYLENNNVAVKQQFGLQKGKTTQYMLY